MRERILRAGLFGVSAFALGYLLPGTLQLPTLFYDPVHHLAHFARSAPSPLMRYYSDFAWACVAGLAAFAIGWMLRPSKTSLAVATGSALSLMALDVLFFLSRLLATM
jgi:hypothetical protein